MLDALKKTLLAGIGLGLMTRDKVEEIAREIADSAQLSADKGQQFVDEAVARAQKGRAEFDARVQSMLDEAVRRAKLTTRDDLARLEARIAELERRVADHKH
jgi:polyhydroxyalkanoate synthesis regulator phasin